MATAPQEPVLVKRVAAIIAAALVIWAFVLMIGGHSGVVATLRAQAQLEELERRLAEQQAHNEALREEIALLESDPSAIEKVAREELTMARADEIVLLVPDVKKLAENQKKPAVRP